MKKIIFVIATIFLVTGCSFSKNNKISYKEIDYSNYEEMIENKDTFVLFIGSASCSHCDSFKPKLENVISEYNLDVKYIDIGKLDEKQYAVLKNKTFIKGTPTTVYIKEGVVQTDPKIIGDKDESEIKSFFEKIDYIKGE